MIVAIRPVLGQTIQESGPVFSAQMSLGSFSSSFSSSPSEPSSVFSSWVSSVLASSPGSA